MDSLHKQSVPFSLATAELIQSHLDAAPVRLTIKTGSMSPALRVGDQVIVKKTAAEQLRPGDVVVLRAAGTLVAHRLIARRQRDGELLLITKGDASPESDWPWHPAALVGIATAVRRGNRETSLETRRAKFMNWILACLSEHHRIANRRKNDPVYKLAAKGLRGALKALTILLPVLLAMLLSFPSSQVWAAVTISSFTVKAQGNQVQAIWTTASEINNVGFNILRSTSQNGAYAKINATIIPSQCLGCVTGRNYAFTDNSASPGQTYYYKLQTIDSNGSTHLFGPATTGIGNPPPTSTKGPATATRTSTAMAKTLTNTPFPTNSPLPRNTISPSTSAATTVPDVPTPIPMRVSLPAPSTATFVPTMTAPAQVAVAVPVATSTWRPTSAPARPVATTPPSTAAQAAPATMAVEPVDDPAGEIVSEEQPAEAAPTPSADPFQSLVLLGMIGALGCGSALSGGLAILVFARSLTRR